mmetsp:Transcript_669/g.1943  ORF Transcript_669/g.1943 Transcript_669/m.1943 type:complete len:306 (+) Transcript_669:720-1637(+)
MLLIEARPPVRLWTLESKGPCLELALDHEMLPHPPIVHLRQGRVVFQVEWYVKATGASDCHSHGFQLLHGRQLLQIQVAGDCHAIPLMVHPAVDGIGPGGRGPVQLQQVPFHLHEHHLQRVQAHPIEAVLLVRIFPRIAVGESGVSPVDPSIPQHEAVQVVPGPQDSAAGTNLAVPHCIAKCRVALENAAVLLQNLQPNLVGSDGVRLHVHGAPLTAWVTGFLCRLAADCAAHQLDISNQLGCESATPVHARRPEGWQERPPDTAVHEHEVLVLLGFDLFLAEQPCDGAPIKAHVLMVHISCIAG